MQKICIYTILSRVKGLRLQVQDSLIYKACNKHPYLMTTTPDGYLSVTEFLDPETLISQWLETSYLEILTESSSIKTKNIKEALTCISPNCILTKFNSHFNTINLLWRTKQSSKIIFEKPNDNTIFPIGVKSDIENLRMLIDRIVNQKGLRLGSFRVSYKVNNFQRLFSGIQDCRFVVCESLKRFKGLSNAKIGHFRVKKPEMRKEIKTTACSPLPLLTRNNSSNRSLAPSSTIDQQISEIMKDDESVKYISYKDWAKKVSSGEHLLPNEEKFAQKLVNYGKKDTSDSAREIQKLVTKMTINLDENRSKRHLQEVLKEGLLKNIIQTVKFPIQEHESSNKRRVIKKKSSILKINFSDQIDKAVEQFDKLQSRVKNHKN